MGAHSEDINKYTSRPGGKINERWLKTLYRFIQVMSRLINDLIALPKNVKECHIEG